MKTRKCKVPAFVDVRQNVDAYTSKILRRQQRVTLAILDVIGAVMRSTPALPCTGRSRGEVVASIIIHVISCC